MVFQISLNTCPSQKVKCEDSKHMFFFLSKDMLRARREGAVFEDLPQRDIDFAESISVLKIQEVYCF